MKQVLTTTFLLFCCLLVAGVASAEKLSIWGSTTCQKRFLEPGAEGLKAVTGVELKVIGNGTGRGMLGLLTGKTPVAAASNDLAGAIVATKKVAKKQGKDVFIPDTLQLHTIFTDDIVRLMEKIEPVLNKVISKSN